mgnify:FL=1
MSHSMAPQGRSRLPKSVPLGVMRDGWGLYRVTVALQSRLIQSHTPHPLTVALQSLPPLTPLTSFPLTLFTTHNPIGNPL